MVKPKLERIGENRLNNKGYNMKIVEYIDSNNIFVEFDLCKGILVKSKYDYFKKGCIKLPKEYYIGKETITNQGCLIKIIDYIDKDNIIIEFQDDKKFKKKIRYDYFLNGNIKNPYCKSIYNVACVGNIEPKLNKKAYSHWFDMLIRYYDVDCKNKQHTYKDCYACDEWLCFENFCKWFNENYYEVDNETMCLDKDILKDGNKLYSPNTCCIVPITINSLFTKKPHNSDLPIGVYIENSNRNKRYRSVNSHLRFKTIQEAEANYKKIKYKRIIEISEKYKNKIPKNVYESIILYSEKYK